MNETNNPGRSVLIVGASRGIGCAMSEEFLKRGWSVTGTVRGKSGTDLHALAEKHQGRLVVEHLDMNKTEEVIALRDRQTSKRFDVLFINAGTANNNQDETIADVSTEEFVRVMITNALSPMRAVETLQVLVKETGLIGVMSSGQGSVANNLKGGHEVYRGTKAALNTYMRSYAARHADDGRALLLLAPGWIRTALGTSDAPFSLEEAVPDIVGTLIAKMDKPGLEYLDRFGKTVPW